MSFRTVPKLISKDEMEKQMKVLVVDLAKCNGCRCCQLACKDEHCGNDWSPYALPQPMTGQFWCKVQEEERGRVPVVRVAYMPVFCGHCDECPVLAAAPECVYRNEAGFVVIDPEAAIGRSDLPALCPHGRVFYNEELSVPQKCTGCSHLLAEGWAEPRCVDACSTGALRFGSPECFEGELGGAVRDAGSHVFYLNMPKRWIAGTVVDRAINEVIIGARVSITADGDTPVAEVETDWCGDFRYYDCERAMYHVHIEADGYEPIDLEADCRNEDVVFDDLFVTRV